MQITGRIISPAERMPLVASDDPVLRRRADVVTKFDDDLGELLDRMQNTMHHEGGVGLAAPQVGCGYRVVVTNYGGELIELVNPEIVMAEGSQLGYEGCLSVPGYMGEVERPEKVRLRYEDRDGRRCWLDAEDWGARVLSHELDHLDGDLFIDCSERVVRLRPELGLRLVFMGTPEFAEEILDSLLDDGFKVVGVVTAPDRRRNRGQNVLPPAVKKLAVGSGIPVLQPESSDDDSELAQTLSWLEPDLIVTAAYGRILPRRILDVPRLGSINVHASLLPEYRGAAPIQRQIMDGATISGVTIYWMDEGMDTGPILHRREIDLPGDITGGKLHDELAELGASTLAEALAMIARGESAGCPQDDSLATFAPKIGPGEARIQWDRDAQRLQRQIRAFNPHPGAETYWRGKRLKILEASVEEGSAEPGRVHYVDEDGILVGTGSGLLRILRLKLEGKREVGVEEFVHGYDIRRGESLGGSE